MLSDAALQQIALNLAALRSIRSSSSKSPPPSSPR
jgi:hypothetical protein